MGQSDIERAKLQAAAYERAKEQLRWLVEQKQLRAAEAEAEAKLRAAEVKNEKPSLQPASRKIRGRKRWKRILAEKALNAKFPGGVTNAVRTYELKRQARDWLLKNHPSLADQISDDTIRAAAGRK